MIKLTNNRRPLKTLNLVTAFFIAIMIVAFSLVAVSIAQAQPHNSDGLGQSGESHSKRIGIVSDIGNNGFGLGVEARQLQVVTDNNTTFTRTSLSSLDETTVGDKAFVAGKYSEGVVNAKKILIVGSSIDRALPVHKSVIKKIKKRIAKLHKKQKHIRAKTKEAKRTKRKLAQKSQKLKRLVQVSVAHYNSGLGAAGIVTSVTGTGLTLATRSGEELLVTVSDNTKVVRTQESSLEELVVGDRALVIGDRIAQTKEFGRLGKMFLASSVEAISADLAPGHGSGEHGDDGPEDDHGGSGDDPGDEPDDSSSDE